VLQKLQEVTLPNNSKFSFISQSLHILADLDLFLVASKSKKPEVASRKDKKDRKKEKKKDKEQSITDVIAVELMEKAKKTIGLDPKLKKQGRTPSPPPAPQITDNNGPEPPTPPRINSSESEREPDDDDFDIPTISEIKTSGGGGQNLHKKELSQLQELQNKINQTKRKLKDLSDSDEDGQQRLHTTASTTAASRRRQRSPEPAKRGSVLSRLGVKPTENSKPSNIISLSAIRKTEKEVYVAPSFRKLIERQKEENDKRETGGAKRNIRERIGGRRSRSRSRERHHTTRESRRRSRSRSPVQKMMTQEDRKKLNIRHRIGSRVIVTATPRDTYDEEQVDVTVNSVVKVKQRPTINNPTQAGKNLLLRAVAEAQRSTSLLTPELKRKQRDHIVVQVPVRNNERAGRKYVRIDEEYVPESISTQSESEAEYHPSYKKQQTALDDEVIYLNTTENIDDLEDIDDEADDDHVAQKSPQFVVTLEGIAPQYHEHSNSSHSPTPPPVIKRKSIKDRIGSRPTKVHWRDDEREQPSERKPLKRQSNDESESQREYNRSKRIRVSPIKFDLTDEERDCSKSRDNSRDRMNKSQSPGNAKRENGDDIAAKKIRLEPSKSYDHVPPCK